MRIIMGTTPDVRTGNPVVRLVPGTMPQKILRYCFLWLYDDVGIRVVRTIWVDLP